MPQSIIGAYDVGSNSCKSRFVIKHEADLFAFLYNLNGYTTDFDVDPGTGPVTVPGGVGDEMLRVFKSSDNGATWAEAGTAFSIPSVASFGVAYCVGVDQETAYLVYAHNVTYSGFTPVYDGVTVAPFDLSTETWGASTDHAISLNAISRGTAPAVLQSREVAIHLATRGSGDMILFYSGPQFAPANLYGRAYCATFDGTSFGAEVEIPGQTTSVSPDSAPGRNMIYWPAAVCCDTAGITHFLMIDSANNTPIHYFNLLHVGMDIDGVFGARSTISSQGYLSDVVGTISDIVTYPTESGERIAVSGLINDDASFTTQSIRVFTAPAELEPASWTDDILMQGIDEDLMSLEQFWWMGVFITICWNCHGVMGTSADAVILQQLTQYYGFDPVQTGELTVVVAWNEELMSGTFKGHYRWFHGLPGSWSTVEDLFTVPDRVGPTPGSHPGFRACTVFSFGEIAAEVPDTPTDTITPSGPAEIILTGGQPAVGAVIVPTGAAQIILTGGQPYLGDVVIPGGGGAAQIILTGGGPPTVTGGGGPTPEPGDLGWILSYVIPLLFAMSHAPKIAGV